MSEEKPAVAITFSFEAKINQSRSIVAQTAIERDADAKDINAVLDKIALALWRQEAKELLKGLKITLERDTKQLETQIAQVSDLKTSYEEEWKTSGRKGEYKPQGQQRSNLDNQDKSLMALRDRIKTVERDIKELETVAV